MPNKSQGSKSKKVLSSNISSASKKKKITSFISSPVRANKKTASSQYSINKKGGQSIQNVGNSAIKNKLTIRNKYDTIIIIRYLKTFLFESSSKSSIKIFIIPNKKSRDGILQNLLDKIIISKISINNVLSYSLIKDEKSNYIVHYFNNEIPIKDLPLTFNIQIKPINDFRIFALCDSSNLNNDFVINEVCFSIAISFNTNNVDDLKSKVLKYLQISNFVKPTIYVFKNNKFEKVVKINQIEDNRKPIFAAWDSSCFICVLKHIMKYIVDEMIQ